MFASVSWFIDARAPNPAAIRADVMTAFAPFQTCVVHPSMAIAAARSPNEFNMLEERLLNVARAHPDLFAFQLAALRDGTGFRANTGFDRLLAAEIARVDPGTFPPPPPPAPAPPIL